MAEQWEAWSNILGRVRMRLSAKECIESIDDDDGPQNGVCDGMYHGDRRCTVQDPASVTQPKRPTNNERVRNWTDWELLPFEHVDSEQSERKIG